jgi:Chaperone of endosialidase
MSDPRPVQISNPGTDFIVFATGAGANVEDMPSYTADPQRQTGNLPGIARSSFNNRVQRQGAFVATAISTFVWEVLSIYVPDDGDLDNYVANFKAALRAYITPEGALPGGPYLPIAGGTMLGNIDFNSGATIVLANNTWLRAKDAGGTSHGMLRLGLDNNHYIGDGSAPFVVFGSTPIIGSGMFWSARDTGGTAHGLLGIQADNNTVINAFNSLYVNSANLWTNSSIIIPNGQWYYTKNAANSPIVMLGTRSDNITVIAQGAPLDTYIYSGRQIILVGQTSITGALYPQGAVNVGGALNVTGATTLASLQVNGASNFYARPNVANSVGMTVTGDVATNSIRVYGGGIVTDSNSTFGGSTQAAYLLVYNPGNNDPMQVRCDPGHYARIAYHHVNVRIWTSGVDSNGTFVISDESGGGYRFWIDVNGNGTFAQSLTIGGNFQVNTNLNCTNQISSNTMVTNYITVAGNTTTRGAMYVGWDGYYFNYIGSGYTYTNGNFRVGNQLECIGNFVCSNTIYASGEGHINGRTYVGDLWSVGNVFISNDEWFYLGNSPSLKWLNFHPYRYLYWNRQDGSLWWSSDNINHTQWQYGGDWYFKNWYGPLIGKGFWVQGLYSANIQLETVRSVEKATDIIAALNPIHFRKVRRLRQRHNAEPYYLDEEPEEVGFLVDEVKQVLPQAVVSIPTRSEVMPEPGYSDPDTPAPKLLDEEEDAPDALITDVILAVAVKAIQEMNARIVQLEQRLSAA